jgi:hypothetical protein
MYAGYALDDVPVSVKLESDFCFEDWPGNEAGDLGSANIGIVGSEFVEAFTLIVSASPEGARIRKVDWGRP